MGNIVSMFSKSPFIGMWVNDGLLPYETVITAENGKLTITSRMILEKGEIADDPDEELHCVVTNITKDTLDYATWYDSGGRRAYRTLMTTSDRNLLLGKITYSDVAPAAKVGTSEEQPGPYGAWQPTDDDFWSEYQFSMDGEQLQVKAFDRGDDVECTVANMQSGEGWISFETETPSDGRQAKLKFIFDASGTNAVMHFTFTEFYRLYRVG